MTKCALLTIDDSPSSEMKRRIDFLYELQIPAIFFCRGDFLEIRPELVIYAIKKGFLIGNHGYSHKRFSEITIERGKEEIKRTDELIDELYEKAGVTRPVKLFRFPYGDRGEGREILMGTKEMIKPLTGKKVNELEIFLKELKYEPDLFWTVETLEWPTIKNYPEYHIENVNQVISRLNVLLRNSDDDEIILTHDHTGTSDIFPKLIETYIELGYTFKPFEEFS